MKFEEGQPVRTKIDRHEVGTVQWHSGKIVRVVQDGTEQQFYEKDLEPVPTEAGARAPTEAGARAFVTGDLVVEQGDGAEFETELLVGTGHKLVWLTTPGRSVSRNSTRIELRTLAGEYVTTVAIGNLSAADLAPALDYLAAAGVIYTDTKMTGDPLPPLTPLGKEKDL